jgi:hypothetical protein
VPIRMEKLSINATDISHYPSILFVVSKEMSQAITCQLKKDASDLSFQYTQKVDSLWILPSTVVMCILDKSSKKKWKERERERPRQEKDKYVQDDDDNCNYDEQ